MADPTPKQILEEHIAKRLSENPALRKDLGAVIHFNITGPSGGQWTLDATRESDFITAGLAGTAKMTLTAADSDFVAVCTRRLNAQMAFMGGKLKLKPMDFSLAMKLPKLLG